MREAIVLDASVALAVLRAEPLGPWAASLLRSHALAAGRVVVPVHFWLEVANVLVRRYRHTATEVIDRVRVLDEFAIESVDLDRTLWLLAIERTASLGLTAYDAAYLALAEALDARLMTLDTSLAAAAGSRAVQLGGHASAEERAPYDARRDVAVSPSSAGAAREPGDVLARFGEYLAELRRQALTG